MNGTHALIASFSFVICLLTQEAPPSNSLVVCGGTYLGHNKILTAAHCFDRPVKRIMMFPRLDAFDWNKIFAQDAVGIPLDVEDVILHPRWNSTTFQNDIALLTMRSQDAVSRMNLVPISLPSVDELEGDNLYWVGGYGTHSTMDYSRVHDFEIGRVVILDRLQFPDLPIDPEVMILAGDPHLVDNHDDTASNVEYTDTCFGDSGGPLFHAEIRAPNSTRFTLIGITSWGVGCGGLFPGVYTRVASFVPWIQDHFHRTTAV